MLPEPKHFTKDNPCTKVDIWNCFRGRRGFVRVQVAEAHAIVGLNAPRYMLSKFYVTVVTANSAEYYKLTKDGIDWLSKKLKTYLVRHPKDRKRVRNLPSSF